MVRLRRLLLPGAFDGWKESNTLHLEACLGWRGITIDGQPLHLEWMRQNRPAALSLGIAVCPTHGRVRYSKQNATTDGITTLMPASVKRRFRVEAAGGHSVPCGPLTAWLRLLGVRHIDFFSLDVQGAELVVLRSLDWARTPVSVGVLVTECKAIGCTDVQDGNVRDHLARTAPALQFFGVFRARHDIWDAVYVNRSWANIEGLELERHE